MSGIFRWRRLVASSPRAAAASFVVPRDEAVASVPAMLHRHVQGLREWDGGGGGEPETRRIRGEVPCPRCSKHMGVLFSRRPLPPLSTAGGDCQALNLCPSCRTAYFFREDAFQSLLAWQL